MINEKDARLKFLEDTALQMMGAARTAPKGKGRDTLEIALLSGKELETLAAEMKKLGAERQIPSFDRDAANVLASQFVVLIGTTAAPLGMPHCVMCGFDGCAKKPKEAPCQFSVVDLGIAVGSAVSVAADRRTDTRIMFTAGQAALKLKLLGPSVSIAYAIPLSCTAKSPYFDRG